MEDDIEGLEEDYDGIEEDEEDEEYKDDVATEGDAEESEGGHHREKRHVRRYRKISRKCLKQWRCVKWVIRQF